MRKKKNKKGITLVALIISIIILIILMSITIYFLTNKNGGIINRAKFAGTTYQNKINEEQNLMLNYTNEMETYQISQISRDNYISNDIGDFTPTVKIDDFIEISIPEIKTNNVKIVGYMYLIDGKVKKYTDEKNTIITDFERNKECTLEVIAVDENAKYKKSNPINIVTPKTIYLYKSEEAKVNGEKMLKLLDFSALYSDGTDGSYSINSAGVLEIYGRYCNRTFGAFKIDLTNYSSVEVEWCSQSAREKTIGCVIANDNKNFNACLDVRISNNIVKYDYASTSFKITTFDVSDMNGIYYIGVFGFESGFNSYIKSIKLK